MDTVLKPGDHTHAEMLSDTYWMFIMIQESSSDTWHSFFIDAGR